MLFQRATAHPLGLNLNVISVEKGFLNLPEYILLHIPMYPALSLIGTFPYHDCIKYFCGYLLHVCLFY